jgi:hypothetical protein
MKLEKVVIKTDEKDLERVQKVIESIPQMNKSVMIGKIIYGRLGDNILLSFNTDSASFPFIFEKLIINNVKVILDSSTEKLRQTVTQKKGPVPYEGWDSLKKQAKPQESIEAIASSGNYQELFKIVKDIRNDKSRIEEAQNAIPSAVSICIQNIYQNAKTQKSRIDDSVNKLLEISADQNLKNPAYIEHTKMAGILAIELWSLENENIYKLIQICNNNQIHKYVNIAAAIRFSKISLENPDANENNLEFAIKKLNLRWLNICFPIVEHEISETDKVHFNKLITYIESRR